MFANFGSKSLATNNYRINEDHRKKKQQAAETIVGNMCMLKHMDVECVQSNQRHM